MTDDLDRDLLARRVSAHIFGNEKVAEIILLLDEEQGALLAADISRRTGFGHSLVRDVLVRLSKTSALRALPKAGNTRGPAYYEKNAKSPLWPSLAELARLVVTSDHSVEATEREF